MAHPEDPLRTANKNISAYYDDLLGDIGIDIFNSRILPIATAQLGGGPEVYSTILKQLVDVAGTCKADELMDLWTNVVSAETFQFHREFNRLAQDDNRRSQRFVFHVNQKNLFRNLSGGTIVPEYILRGKPFDPIEADWDDGFDADFYHVCFADGTIDELAAFLSGHALLNANITHHGQEKAVNSHIIPSLWEIGVFDFDLTDETGPHEAMAPCEWSDDIFISMRSSIQPVPLRGVIPIPFTVLLPGQVEELKERGRRLFDTGVITNWMDNDITNRDAAGLAYQATMHQRLATKFALQQFIEANG